MVKLNISLEKCENCNKCVDICPEGIFKKHSPVPKITSKEHCMSCGQCSMICPTSAITHENYSKKQLHSMNPELNASPEQIMQIIKSRRSTRAFQNKKISPSIIEKIIEAANFAPSAKNKQTTRYVVVTNPEILKSITEITFNFMKEAVKLFNNTNFISSVNPDEAKVFLQIKPSYEHIIESYECGYDLILHNAPTVIFFHAEKSALSAEVNANLALENASLMSTALGIGSFYAGYITGASIRTEFINKLINIPPQNQVYAVLAIGHPKYEFKKWADKNQTQIKWI
jgi:nitroreductase/NAD-dependent dihydropyrimidine dehydrogenase PreA subunit